MADFTAKDVQRLRQVTGAGMMDAKNALQETSGDQEAAAKLLRERGLAQSAKRSGRENVQGAVAVAVNDKAGAIVQLRCETDFTAKSPDFVKLVQVLADLVADKGEGAVAERQDDVDRLKVSSKENVELGEVVYFDAADGAVIDSYLHIQNDRGVNAVLVELQGGTKELAHDIAVHIAFARPEYLSRDDVPADVVEAARNELEAISRNEGKPEAALPKIVEGRLNGWYKDRVLLDQAFAKDEKQTIGQVLGAAKVNRFAQVTIGS
ncbi:MAG: elongation factor Ts [Actinomycetota bacterium]|nr:elongation factor Ts [Actinomycetota bacterium]